MFANQEDVCQPIINEMTMLAPQIEGLGINIPMYGRTAGLVATRSRRASRTWTTCEPMRVRLHNRTGLTIHTSEHASSPSLAVSDVPVEMPAEAGNTPSPVVPGFGRSSARMAGSK